MSTSSSIVLDQRGVRRSLGRWRSRTAATLGTVPADWYDELSHLLVVALRTGRDDVAVLHGFIRRRVRGGWGLHATMDDLERLRCSLGPRRRWTRRWRLLRLEAASAFADAMVDDLLFSAVRDPLSGLPSCGYLAVYLEEMVAATDPDDDVRAHLVTALATGSGTTVTNRLAIPILVARALQSAVPPGVLVALVRDGCYVLVLPPLLSPGEVQARIEAALRQHSGIDSVVIDSTELPRTRTELVALLAAWRRERRIDRP